MRGGDGVSIAEAILWGEQLDCMPILRHQIYSFNRRGDSLGGATIIPYKYPGCGIVSIAEAILWGEQLGPRR